MSIYSQVIIYMSRIGNGKAAIYGKVSAYLALAYYLKIAGGIVGAYTYKTRIGQGIGQVLAKGRKGKYAHKQA